MIHCEQLTRQDETGGVFDLDMHVDKGQALGLLGPAGSGKSLAVGLLMGFLKKDSGSAAMFGKDCWTMRHEIQRRVAYAPSEPSLEPFVTGEEYLRFAAKYQGGFDPEKARRFTERLDVSLTGLCARMSPEAQKKLRLLAAFSLDRDVLILDEPMNMLSVLSKDAVYDAVHQATQRGCAVFMTSHVLEETRRACTHIAIIRQGRLVISQPVEALNLTRQKVYHITFETANQAASFAGEWESAVEVSGARALVAIPGSPQVLLKALARYTVVDLVGGREASEEGFLRFYGDDIV